MIFVKHLQCNSDMKFGMSREDTTMLYYKSVTICFNMPLRRQFTFVPGEASSDRGCCLLFRRHCMRASGGYADESLMPGRETSTQNVPLGSTKKHSNVSKCYGRLIAT